MNVLNQMQLEFPSRSANEAFARTAVACFAAQMDPTVEELNDIAQWLIEVQTPLGKLKRLRPIIQYSESVMNELLPWPAAGKPGAVWAD